jgi:C4-type Zn-finger protein
MKCPKCNNEELKEQVSIFGLFFKKKKIVFYCPLCEFRNEQVFILSKEDVEVENTIRLNLEKKTTINYNTKKEVKNGF